MNIEDAAMMTAVMHDVEERGRSDAASGAEQPDNAALWAIATLVAPDIFPGPYDELIDTMEMEDAGYIADLVYQLRQTYDRGRKDG